MKRVFGFVVVAILSFASVLVAVACDGGGGGW